MMYSICNRLYGIRSRSYKICSTSVSGERKSRSCSVAKSRISWRIISASNLQFHSYHLQTLPKIFCRREIIQPLNPLHQFYGIEI